MPGPNWGTLANFTGALRKKLLIPFGLFSPGDNLGFLMSVDAATELTVTGTVNGVNAVFTLPATTGLLYQVYKNGVLQKPNVMYTLSGNTITFIDPYVPKTGDELLVYGY